MERAILIDRVMGAVPPTLASDADVRALEAVPLTERLAVSSTYEALRLGAAQDPARAAIHFLPNADPDEPGLPLSHGEFFRRVTQAANLFHQLGVGPNDVVSLMLPLLPQNFYAMFGAEAAGIANPVNPLLEPRQIAEILRAAGTKVLVALGPTPGTDIWAKVQAIRDQVPSLQAVLQVRLGPPAEGDTTPSFDEQLAAMPGDHLLSGRRIGFDDVAAYFHTGGTTGTPKLVRHTHLNQLSQAWGMAVMFPGQPGRCTLYGLPLYHVGGALSQALAGLVQAGTLVVLSASGWRNPSALRHVWRLVQRFQAPLLTSVPTVLAAAAQVSAGDADVSCIRYVSGGGSAIPVAVGEALQRRLNVPVVEVYGMTEVSSVLVMGYADRPLRLGSVGHALPYHRVRVVKLDAAGGIAGDCAVDEIGVVLLAGSGAFSGYVDARHNQGAFAAPGWVNSGDLGRLDAEGYLWLTGRAKDLIIRGAHNIDPLPLEELLYQHPDVVLAAIVGQPDAYAGEVPLAYVQLKPGASTDAEALLAHLRANTPERAAVPVAVRLIDAIPLTGVGKVFKPQLRWDAARAHFAQLLAPLAQPPLSLEVSVGADAQYGSLATVRLGRTDGAALASAERAALVAQVDALLNPFELRHVCV